MPRLSREERAALAEQLAGWIDRMVRDESAEVTYSVTRGMHLTLQDDLETTVPEPNGSATLVVHINGGTRNTGEFADPPNAP